MRAVLRLLTDHLTTALLIGVLASWWYQEWWLIGVALLTGWLIDADHLVDLGYYLRRCKPGAFQRSMLTSGGYFKLNNKVIVPLHSWELVALWFCVWFSTGHTDVAITGALAWGLHLLHDQRSYRVTPLGYFFSFRLLRNFGYTGFCRGAASSAKCVSQTK